jgi:GAF domain-containing protein
LAEIGRLLSDTQLDVTRLAEVIYQQASQIVETAYFQLGLFEDDRYRLVFWVSSGERRAPAEFRLTAANPGLVGWIRDTRQSLIVHDYEKDALPAQPRYISTDPPRSAVFVPLLVREVVRGVMAIQSRQPNAFTEEHQRLLTIIANQAAAALENARLYEQTHRRAAQLELLTEISRRINVLQLLPALYKQTVTLIAETFRGYAVYFYEAQGEALHLRAQAGDESEAPIAAVQFGETLVGEAAQRREALLARQLPEFGSDVVAHLYGPPARLVVPVEIDNRVLGVLDIHSALSAGLDESALSVFKSLAAQIALAILEAQVYEVEQRRAEHLDALAQASRVVASTLELEDLLEEVLDLIDEKFGYKSARIFLLNADQLVYAAGTGSATFKHDHQTLAYALEGPGLIAQVGRTRQLLVVADVTQHPDYVPSPGLSATRAEMIAPMVMGPQLIGVFDVQAEAAGAFTDEDTRTLQTLADTLAVAVRNARLFEQERRRRRLAEIMREVSAALTSTLQLDQVLDLILDGLAMMVDYDAASILLADEGTGSVILRAGRGIPGLAEVLGAPLNITLYPSGETIPAVLPFDDADAHHDYRDLLGLPDPHACLAATLAPRGEHLGYLVVDRAGDTRLGAGRFQRSEMELIAAFASQAAVAIENARLYTAQREQAWISAALLQVAEATARALELDEVLTTVARLTPMLAGVDRCAVFLNADGAFRLKAYEGVNEAYPVEEIAQRLPRGLNPAECPKFGDLLKQREPVVLDPDDQLPATLRDLFVGVVILLPLLAKNTVEGVLVVGQSPGETPFMAHRIRLMTGIANQAALAIESALLTVAQKEEAWVSTALLQVAEAVAGQPLELGLQTVARLTPILVGVEKIAIYQLDFASQRFQLRQVTGLDRAVAAALREMPATATDLGLDHPAELAVGGGGDTLPPNYVQWALPPAIALRFGVDAAWIWPLRARGDVLGALVVDASPIGPRRLAILNGIAHQLAMALENARLTREVAQQERLEHELALGRDIQRSFLPQTYPQAVGWEIAAYWRAARQVGGDFYDFIPLRPSEHGPRWGIVIADVADKGVPAALFMALSRTLLRTVAVNRISPADTLARVNELILADVRTNEFVTAFYGVWEPATGQFTYATAGHNPPIWFMASGEVKTLPGRGSALGVFDDARYKEFAVQLAPGDGLVLYTDGLTDAINAQREEFTLQRALDILAVGYTYPAQGLLDHLASAVQAHEGEVQAFDDLTMVVVKRLNE